MRPRSRGRGPRQRRPTGCACRSPRRHAGCGRRPRRAGIRPGARPSRRPACILRRRILALPAQLIGHGPTAAVARYPLAGLLERRLTGTVHLLGAPGPWLPPDLLLGLVRDLLGLGLRLLIFVGCVDGRSPFGRTLTLCSISLPPLSDECHPFLLVPVMAPANPGPGRPDVSATAIRPYLFSLPHRGSEVVVRTAAKA